jgi:hypothetical protein
MPASKGLIVFGACAMFAAVSVPSEARTQPGLPELRCPATEKYAGGANLDEYAFETDDGETIDRTPVQNRLIGNGLERYLAGVSGRRPVIVVHFHGGLVDRCEGYADAARFIPRYAGSGAYPIFPVYNVGLGESVDKGWSGLSARDPRRRGDGRSMPWATRFLYPKGLLADDVPDVRSYALLTRLRLLAHVTDRRLLDRRDHGIPETMNEQWLRYGPIPVLNEGLITGGRAWSYMKFSIDRSLKIDSGVRPDLGGGGGAGLMLMTTIHDAIARYESTPGAPRVRIMLVGHSTGAIYIAKWLRAWNDAYRSDPARFEIVYLAPAVRYDVLNQTLQEAGGHIADGRFRVFTMNGAEELDNSEGPAPGVRRVLFRPSLLYAISGIFERDLDAPLVGMARFHEPNPPFPPPGPYPTLSPLAPVDSIPLVDSWLRTNAVKAAFIFSPTPDAAPPGVESGSCLHSDFVWDQQTIDSLEALTRGNGWDAVPVPGTGTCSEVRDNKGRKTSNKAAQTLGRRMSPRSPEAAAKAAGPP